MPSKIVPKYWAGERRLLPHARKCLEFIDRDIEFNSQNDPTIFNAVHKPGTLSNNQDKLADAETMYQGALDGYKKAWGPESTSILDTVNDLGALHKNQGKLEEAEAMFLRVKIRKPQTTRPSSPLTIGEFVLFPQY